MSAYTTLYITRSKARSLLLEHILGTDLDDTLEKFLDSLLASRLYNAVIVSDDAPHNDDSCV